VVDEEKKLFQENTIGVRMITAFLVAETKDYLVEVLAPTVNAIIKDPSHLEVFCFIAFFNWNDL
jgi:hypothetical protein